MSDISTSGQFDWGGVLQAGTDIAVAGINAGSTKASQKRAFKFNKQLMDHQDLINDQNALDSYNRAIEAWHMTNEYNDPSAARQRYEDAGMNPALAYGGGSAGVNTAGGLSPAPASEVGVGSIGTPTLPVTSPNMLALSEALVNRSIANKNNAEADSLRGETKPTQVEMDLHQSEKALVDEKIIGQRVANDLDALRYELDKEWKPQEYELNNKILTRRAETAFEELVAARNENALYPQKVEQINAHIENMYTDTLLKRANATLAKMQSANAKYDWVNIKPQILKKIKSEIDVLSEEARKSGFTADILRQDLDTYDSRYWNSIITSYMNSGANLIGSVGSLIPK